MTTFWKYFFVVFFILAVPVAAYFGYRSYRSLKNPSSPAFNAIVPSTPVIIEFLEPSDFVNKLNENTDFWKELTNISSIGVLREQMNQFDSILSTNSQMKTIFEQHKLFICLHPSEKEGIEPLFIAELPSIGYKYTIENFIKEVNGEKSIVLQKKYLNTTISKLNIAGLERLFAFAIHKGVFIGSFEEALIRKAIDQLETGVPVTEGETFNRLEVAAGKNVDANVFVNHSGFSKLARSLTSKQNHMWLNFLNNLGDWSETDLIIKPQELLLTGYTLSTGDGSMLLDSYRQEPQSIKIPEVLPHDISLLFHFAYTDFRQHLQMEETYREVNQIKPRADSLLHAFTTSNGFDPRHYFYPWIGKEVALALTGEANDTTARKYLVIHASDIKAAVDSIESLSHRLLPSERKKKSKAWEEEFEDYTIRHLQLKGLFQVLFGSLFEGWECPYYFSIRDYVVFANSPGALKYLITNFYVQKTLAVNTNFRSFSNGISDKSNIFFYCNTRRSIKTISDFVSEDISKVVKDNSTVIRTFEGIAVQFSYTADMFYTSIYLRYNPLYEEEKPDGWITEISGNVIGKPFLTRNEETGKLNVVVFDDLNNIYLIDHFGKIMWKTPLIDLPLSQIYVVDNYRDGEKQFLFNTGSYLYLIDRSGNYVGDYPIKFMAEATCGIEMLENLEAQDYRLLVALSDNRVYNLDINAKATAGWQKVSTAQPVKVPVQHLQNNDKDYIFITDENGSVTIVNRKGEPRISLKKGFRKAKNSEFYINQTNSKGTFITTDTDGKLVYVTENGKVDRTDFGEYSSEHFFLYEDITKDDSRDFIFVDQNKLHVFDRMKEPVLEFQFPEKITVQPVTFKASGDQWLIGVVAVEEGKIYLFNQNGQVYKDNSFTGNTPFAVGSINGDGKLNLVIGDGNKIVNYLLE